MNKIIGRRSMDELLVSLDGRLLDPAPSQKLYNHSPDGFDAGYGGSGVAQLALAILLKVVGREKALQHYQSFKWQVLADEKYLNDSFTIELDIKNWVKSQEETGCVTR